MAEIPVGTAVGWVVSPIIKLMFEKVQSYMSDQYNWNSNLKDDLEKVELSLMEIELALSTARRPQELTDKQAKVLHKLKQVVYDAEDLLDEFDYMHLKDKVDRQSTKTRIASYSCIIGHRLIGRDKFKSKLKEILKILDRVKACTDMFVRVMGVMNSNAVLLPEIPASHVTSSVSPVKDIIGRDEERDKLVDLLLGQDDRIASTTEGTPEVLSIVGVGGIGKTTLARLIYDDERIANNFDLRIWICVSDTFEKIRLSKEILASMDRNIDMSKLLNFSQLQEELRDRSASKKFLLVLDDVWYDEAIGDFRNKERWSELFAPFRYAKRRSKILVTTRMKLVGNILNSVSFPLECLGSDASWSLLRACAFGTEDPENHPELKSIGQKIVEGLKGSALAIKVVGGRLNGNFDLEEWKRVQADDLSKSNDIMAILRSSYEHLPEHLQRCFAYCSLFPKAWHLEPSCLVSLWISQGFVQQTSSDASLEDVGRGYFNDLTSRSFIETHEDSFYMGERYYVMHDLLNDLALRVSEGECFRLQDSSCKGIPSSVRHLSVCGEASNKLGDDCGLERLRTLIVLDYNPYSMSSIGEDVFKRLKRIRALDLHGRFMKKLPNTIGSLVHLRYLALRCTEHQLPASLGELYHLQLLSLNCYLFPSPTAVSLPKVTRNLMNLLRIDFPRDVVILLSEMDQLRFFYGPGEYRVKASEELQTGDSIGARTQARWLYSDAFAIQSLENVESGKEALKAQLDHREDITNLKLAWGSSACSSNCKKDNEVLEALRPHHDLLDLTLEEVPGDKFPSWLQSNYLAIVRTIEIFGCSRCKQIPPFGKLPLLKVLRIHRMTALKRIGPEFYGSRGFPSLELLDFDSLPALAELSCPDDHVQVFRNAKWLKFLGCPKLTKFPLWHPHFTCMSITNASGVQWSMSMPPDYARYWFGESFQFCPYVMDPNEQSFLDFWHLQILESMRVLRIDFVGGIMPKNGLQHFKSIRRLDINRCSTQLSPVIIDEQEEDIPGLLPSSLLYLKIFYSALTVSLLSALLRNLDSLSELRIERCCFFCDPPSQNFVLSLQNLKMLQELDICSCKELMTLEGSEGFVCLKKLRIIDCQNLLYLPNLECFPALQELHMAENPRLEALTKNGVQAALEGLSIRHCHGLRTLGTLQDLASLQRLRISYCCELSSLPKLDGFFSLKELVILYCRGMKSLPKNGLPVSLHKLELGGCHPTLQEQLRRKKGADWDEAAALTGCKSIFH